MPTILKFSLIIHEHPKNKSLEETKATLLKTLNIDDWSRHTHKINPWKTIIKDVSLGRTLQLDCEVETANKLRTHPDKDGHLVLCRAWAADTSNFCDFPDSHRPWLTISEESMLYAKRRAHHETIAIESLSFGSLVHPSLFYIHHQEKDTMRAFDNPLNSNWYHNFKYIRIDIASRQTSVELQYSSIGRLLLSTDGTRTSLYLQLSHPPASYRLITEEPNLDNLKKPRRQRILTCFEDFNETDPYRTNKNKEIYGKSNVLKFVFDDHKVVYQIASRLPMRCRGIPIHWVAMEELCAAIDLPKLSNFKQTMLEDLSFDCAYVFNAILERNFVFSLQCDSVERFRSAVFDMERQSAECLEVALIRVLNFVDMDYVLDYLNAIRILYDYFVEDHTRTAEFKLPKIDNIENVRRCIITPSRVLYYPKQLMFTNRFLRTFSSEFALKVSFRDENKLKLSKGGCTHRDVYQSSIWNPMLNDLEVQQRRYTLLAWSNSQLRDHSVWMYVLDSKHKSANSIRRRFGDFSKIPSVPKYMARLGQCFTSTEDTVHVPLDRITTIDDVMAGRHPISKKQYCFSDGVGMISVSLMEQVCVHLELKVMPSAVQIRCDGYKGMLALNPNLQGDRVVFRKSMQKFECPDGTHALEIVKHSKPIPVHLNKPMISILDHLEVPSSVFIKLQEKMLKKFTDVLLMDAEASEILSQRCSLPALEYRDLSASGVCLNSDPFFRRLLLQVHKTCIEDVRRKSRLEIDPSLGRTMFGVMDETAELEYGQVFVQYTEEISSRDNPDRKTLVLKGPVMVTKNPCIQPGDIRILEAVDVTDLRHLVDVIVFPQKGPRPHPNEMAGSDLDGDEYSVIWDRSLMFQGGNREPSVFPVPREPRTKDIKERDIVNFLVNYVQNDQLGIIGHAHLAISDQQGLFSDVCETIAQKYSLAADFAKYGQLRRLDESERPKEWPDFMEKGETRKTYESQRVLGKLFKICQSFEAVIEENSFVYQNVQLDPDLIYPGWERFKCSSQSSLTRYNSSLNSICTRLGVSNEIQVFVGTFTKNQGFPILNSENYEFRQILSCCIANLWKEFQAEFETTEISELSSKLSALSVTGKAVPEDVRRLQKASAWYMAAYSQSQPLYLSFAWIVSKYLTRIKSLASKERFGDEENPLLVRLDRELTVFEPKIPVLIDPIVLHLDAESGLPSGSRLALRALLEWADYEGIFRHPNKKVSMKRKSFVELFLCSIRGDTASTHQTRDRNDTVSTPVTTDPTPVKLIIGFLRFCATIDSEGDAKLLNLKDISLRVYHTLSIDQSLSALGLTADPTVNQRQFEMDPIKISNAFVRNGRVMGYMNEYSKLKEYSGVNEVNFQEEPDRGEAFVSASGTIKSINMLKNLLKRPEELSRILVS